MVRRYLCYSNTASYLAPDSNRDSDSRKGAFVPADLCAFLSSIVGSRLKGRAVGRRLRRRWRKLTVEDWILSVCRARVSGQAGPLSWQRGGVGSQIRTRSRSGQKVGVAKPAPYEP
jgi:hypothetical protein